MFQVTSLPRVHLPPITLGSLELAAGRVEGATLPSVGIWHPPKKELFLFSHATHGADRVEMWGFIFPLLTPMFFPTSANKRVKLKNNPREESGM